MPQPVTLWKCCLLTADGWTLLSETTTAHGWDDQPQGVDGGTAGELLAAPVAVSLQPNGRYL